MTTSTHALTRRPTLSIYLDGLRPLRAVVAVLAASVMASLAFAGKAAQPRSAEDDFGADVELAPFVVRGQQLAVSVHARSARDRKYAEAFAEDVVKVVYEGVTERTGKGLVIAGAKGEPHPVAIFRKFHDMAAAGQLDPEVAALTGELSAFLNEWTEAMNDGKDAAHEDGDDLEVDVEEIINAFPLPLEGVGAKLYQIAWSERFDDAKLTARLCSLKVDDLKRDLFVHFDWVFYLPPRGMLDRALNEIIAEALKKEELGFFTRAAAKTVLVIAKPFIRRAIEGMRKGVMFMTVVRVQTDYEDKEVSELMDAYVKTMMPGAPSNGGRTAHDRAVVAVRQAADRLRTTETASISGPAMSDVAVAEDRPLVDETDDQDVDVE